MFDESQNPGDRESIDRLATAVEGLRSSAIQPDVLFRAETKILSRLPVRRQSWQQALLWSAGVAVAAAVVAVTLAPTKSFAAELRRIALNADSSVGHVRNYEVEADGSLKLTMEEYTDGNRARFIDMFGNQITSIAGKVTMLHPDGCATVEYQPGHRRQPTTASQIVSLFIGSERISGVTSSVSRGIKWHGMIVDKFTATGTFRDGQNISRQSHITVIADSRSERPIEIDSELSGLQSSVSKWDYPANDENLFKLPITEKTRVFDLDAEHATILDGLSKSGRRVTVGGKTVELIQLWVDEGGSACAIAKADYAYPCNYGIHIDDLNLSTEPEDAPFSGRYAIVQPSKYNRQPTQLFFTARPANAGSVPYKDRVTLQIPVFADKKYLGFAKFEDVPVHRAWNLFFMLRPMNLPFWDDQTQEQKSTPTQAASADR